MMILKGSAVFDCGLPESIDVAIVLTQGYMVQDLLELHFCSFFVLLIGDTFSQSLANPIVSFEINSLGCSNIG